MSTRRELLDNMADCNQEELLCADGFDEALLGVIRRCGQPPVVAYDCEKCIQLLMDRDGMTREDAEEYFEFNTVGAWVGDQTPAFVEGLEDPEGEVNSTIPREDYLGVVGTCDCGGLVRGYLCNTIVVALRPEAARFDYWALCTNPLCEHRHGEGYFQELPSWIKEPEGEMDPASVFQIQCGLEPTYPLKPTAPPSTFSYLTDHIVQVALAALREHQQVTLPVAKLQGLDRAYSPAAFAMNWGSLALRFRRRAGHSTAAAHLLHLIPNAVLLIPSCEVQDDLYRRALEKAITPEGRGRIIKVHREPRHQHFSAFEGTALIIIDNARALRHPHNYDGIAEVFSAIAPNAFYLLLD